MSLLCSDLRAIVEPLTLNAVGSPDGLRLNDSTTDPSVKPRSRSRLRSTPCASRDTTTAARPGGRASSLHIAEYGTVDHRPGMCSGLAQLPTSRKFRGPHYLVPEYGIAVRSVMVTARTVSGEIVRRRGLESRWRGLESRRRGLEFLRRGLEFLRRGLESLRRGLVSLYGTRPIGIRWSVRRRSSWRLLLSLQLGIS